jgi:glycine cleavage system aminomethyltransferase T
VRLGKGEFIGRDAARQLKGQDVRRRLRCMVTEDPALLLTGREALLDGDRPVGYVTSAGYGATVAESILFGYLPAELADVGTTLGVYAAGEAHPVTVVSDPLFDPANERLKGAAAPAAA